MLSDASSAPPRRDLPFLRHRSRPRVSSAAPPISFARPDRSPTPAPHAGTPRPAAPGLDLSAPVPAVPPVSSAPVPAVSALDLSAAPAASPAPARRAGQAPSPQLRGARVAAGQHHLLGVTDPTVVLTRVQSGIGQLRIQAAWSTAHGDFRLGAAYQLRSGRTSIVGAGGGNRFAPSARRPVIVGGHDEFEHLRVDLRQVGDLERLAIYAYSESRVALTWAGTLVVTTFGGARIELPLEALYAGQTAVLMSIYNVAGQLVVRAEMETIVGGVRDAARAYGYDQITWRDDRTPVD